MTTIFIIAALGAFLVPLLGRALARRRDASAGWSEGWWWVPLAGCLVMGALVSAGLQSGQNPMVTIRGGLLTVALLVSGGWMILRQQPRMDAARDILSWMTVVLLISSLIDPPAPTSAAVDTPWFILHFSLIFLGFGGMALSFVISAMFLVVGRRLKNKDLEGIGRLPTLDSLDLLNFRSQSLGFVALTAGIAMGAFLLIESQGGRAAGDLTVWGSVAVWLWYAAGLHARLVLGWRGRLGAIFGVVGFGGLGAILAMAGAMMGGWHGA